MSQFVALAMKLLAIRRRTRFVRSRRKRGGKNPRSRVGLTRRQVCAPSLTYSRTHLLAPSLTHLRLHLLTCACTYSLTGSLSARFVRRPRSRVASVGGSRRCGIAAAGGRFGARRNVNVGAKETGRARGTRRGSSGRRSTRWAYASRIYYRVLSYRTTSVPIACIRSHYNRHKSCGRRHVRRWSKIAPNLHAWKVWLCGSGALGKFGSGGSGRLAAGILRWACYNRVAHLEAEELPCVR